MIVHAAPVIRESSAHFPPVTKSTDPQYLHPPRLLWRQGTIANWTQRNDLMVRIKDTKPNAAGRSSGIVPGRLGKVLRPPKGKPWCWLTRELLKSPAWRMQSINCRRFIDFLLVEYQNHAGTENGNLKATYDQLVKFGLTRSQIHSAVCEAGFLGLAKVMQPGGRWALTNQPSTYRLTFYADKNYAPATNEWKGKTAEAIKAWKQDQAALKRARKECRKKQIARATSRTTVVLVPELPGTDLGKS